MKQKFTEKQKQAFVIRFNKGESVSNLCLKTQIARSTIYSWIKKYHGSITKSSLPILCKELYLLETQIIRQTQIIGVLQSVDCSQKAPLRGSFTH